jgi:hypothetical protein
MVAGFGLGVPIQSIRQFGVPHHGTAISRRAPNPTFNGVCHFATPAPEVRGIKADAKQYLTMEASN